MNLMRYEPWDSAHSLRREMDRLFGNTGRNRDTVADWVPAVDLREEEERFLLHVDLPGVDPTDVEVAVEEGVLSVTGHRQTVASETKDGYRRVERASGKFFRRFTLPDGVDADGVGARCDNGVLEISIPKAAQAQRKLVQVDVN